MGGQVRPFCFFGLAIFLIVSAQAQAQPTKSRFETHVVSEPSEDRDREVHRLSVQGEALRTLPGALGDPFRILGAMPGVTTPIAFLPWFAIRGASPGMSGFFVDGMQLPQLFHMLVGGGVVHAGLVEQIEFFPSAYDATLGHFAGGVAAARTRAARADGQHLEIELRAFDVSALVELKLPRDVRISVSGHYGYPGPIIKAIDKRVDLTYWDYQLRLDWRGLTVQALGSYDSLVLNTELFGAPNGSRNMRTTFHRLQVRQRVQRGALQAEAALIFGIDEAGDTQGRSVRKLFMSARANLRYRWRWLRLYAGIEGELSQFHADHFTLFTYEPMSDARPPGREPAAQYTNDELGEIADDRLGGTASIVLQARAELFSRRVTLTAGARLDLYRAGAVTLLGIDPRLQLHLILRDWLNIHIGAGLYQQPPSSPIQLPGVDTFALKLGLQRAVHGALTEEFKLPAQLTLQLTGYYQKFFNTTDVPPYYNWICASPPPEKLTGATARLMRMVDGNAYGMEFMLRRQTGRFSGWIAYTLSRSERHFPCGLRPADYDQAHTLNVVAQVRLPGSVMVGARLSVASGRPVTQVSLPDVKATPRNNQRLPTYVQLDLRIDRKWQFRRWSLSTYAEVVNATFSTTVLSLSYPWVDDPPGPDYRRPQLDGFPWILPSLGLRGAF
jgi:hypothetical protein